MGYTAKIKDNFKLSFEVRIIKFIRWENLKGKLRYLQGHSSNNTYLSSITHNTRLNGSIIYKDNYFEEIAIQYLKSVIGSDEWIRTPDNEPGHDGCLCIYFDGHITEWWMEAKYSLSPNNLSRGRLDATIIEVLLNKAKNIERLFVITNCDISAKIKTDIRLVVTNNSTCHNIDFVTKDLLELWLVNHYDIYSKYFENPVPQSELSLSSGLFITKDLEIYDVITSQGLQQNVQTVLYPHKKYNLYFSVYSDKPTILIVRSKYFDFNKNGNSIPLKEGINECKITTYLTDCGKQCKEIVSLSLKDKQTNKTIYCKTAYSLDILDNKVSIVLTTSQKKCLSEIGKNINKNSNKFQLFEIWGNSGMGKTFVSSYIPDRISSNSIIEYESFTEDPYVNAKYILKTLLYVYFPYAYGDNISESMKEVIRNNFNSGFFLHALASLNIAEKPELLLSLFRETCDMYLFPPLESSYKQYIIWDNISKLDSGLLRFIILFIRQLKLYDENISFVLVLNNLVYDLSLLADYKYEINISSEDVENIFGIQFQNEDINNFFPDLLTIYDLKEFIDDYNLPISTTDEFKLNYLNFLHGDGKATLIEKKLLNLFPEESLLLNRIYYSYYGISLEECFRGNDKDKIHSIVIKLIDRNLIKYNHEQKLVPYHDIYKNYYKKRYQFNKKSFEFIEAKSIEEELKNQLLSLNVDNVQYYCEQIKTILDKQKFYSVYFILEDLLKYQNVIMKQIGLENYLKLKYYRIYADANVKMSNISAYLQFSDLWNQLKNLTPTLNGYQLILHTLYESSNAAYDNFDYHKCFEFKKEANNLEYKMKKLGYSRNNSIDIDFCYNQIDYMVLLAKSELGEHAEFKEINNYEGIYRFMRSRCTSFEKILEFIDLAKGTLTDECYNNNYKHYIKADFDVAFLETILKKNSELWFDTLIAKRKRFSGINDNYYIKATHSIISVLLVFHLNTIAENMFDILLLGNNQNPRLQYYNLEILAAINAYKHNKNSAINYLEKQLKLCESIRSYARIVEHNLFIIKTQSFNNRFQFYIEHMELKPDTFLLDPRCFY